MGLNIKNIYTGTSMTKIKNKDKDERLTHILHWEKVEIMQLTKERKDKHRRKIYKLKIGDR